MPASAHYRRAHPVPTPAVPGARFSRQSAVVLVGGVAAALATVYGARDEPIGELPVEIALAAGIVALVLAPVPLALSLFGRRTGVFGLTIALLSAGAGAIHYAVIRDHFDEYWLYGLFFVLMALFQLVWAIAAITRPSRMLLALGVLGNALIVAAWVVTRTAGLLIGPSADEVEPVGLADALATGFEVFVIAGCLVLFVRADPTFGLRRRRAEALTWALFLLVTGATTLGMLSAIGAAPGVLPPAA